MTTQINSTTEFDKLVTTEENVLVDFWATWCPPCKAMNPILEDLANEMSDTLTIAKVDVDKQQALAGRYGITSIPTMIRFKNGTPVDQIVGAQPKQRLGDYLRQATA